MEFRAQRFYFTRQYCNSFRIYLFFQWDTAINFFENDASVSETICRTVELAASDLSILDCFCLHGHLSLLPYRGLIQEAQFTQRKMSLVLYRNLKHPFSSECNT